MISAEKQTVYHQGQFIALFKVNYIQLMHNNEYIKGK